MKDAKVIRNTAKLIQQEFKKLYFEWEIEHVRPLTNFVALTPEGQDTCLSRHEFTEAVLDHKYRAPAGIPTQYGKFVNTTGGFTRLTVKKPDGTLVVSKYNFSPKSNFFKALGFVKAAYKAVGENLADLGKDRGGPPDAPESIDI